MRKLPPSPPEPARVPYGRQFIDDADVAAVVEVLRSDRVTQGPAVQAFEDALALRVRADHVVAFSSGTAALHAAAAAGRLGTGDLVVTSPLTFVASANCARYVGAEPCLVDVDAATLNLNVSLLPTNASALVAVHYAGLPMDISRLGRRPQVVIEDACHALGATTPSGPVGNCAHSDMTVFSFHPVKHITTGEGGAVTTNDSGLADRLRLFRSHGMVPNPDEGGWAYDVASVGYNYRLTDIQAVLGTSQLGKLEAFVARRQEIADRYTTELADLPLVLPPRPPQGFTHAYHLYPVQVADRSRVYNEMLRRGIDVQVHFVPLYRHSTFAGALGGPDDYPAAERVYSGLLSLPIFPALTDDEQSRVIATLRKAL